MVMTCHEKTHPCLNVKIGNQSNPHFKIVNDDVYPYQLLIYINSINTNVSCIAKNITYRYFSRIHNIYTRKEINVNKIFVLDLCRCKYLDQVNLTTLVTTLQGPE